LYSLFLSLFLSSLSFSFILLFSYFHL
jgi:hypothetical protein